MTSLFGALELFGERNKLLFPGVYIQIDGRQAEKELMNKHVMQAMVMSSMRRSKATKGLGLVDCSSSSLTVVGGLLE